jgi:vacuolar-type H+-ATPase subunit H
MQKVWEELKNIEAQADQIQSDAKTKAKQITAQAKKDAETLLANSRTYGTEEAKKRYDTTIAEANKSRQQQLDDSDKAALKLKAQAEKRMDKAVTLVVDAVLEEKLV